MRWRVCGMLFLATVISYIDRQAMSVAAPVIAGEFNLDNESIARILSSFLMAYGFGQLVMGLLFDWAGSRIGFAISIGWWSLSNALTALVTRPIGFSILRFGLGLGEAGNFPGGVKLISEWFRPHERAFAGGLFASGGSVGAVVAAPLLAAIITHWGWRAAFAITGSLGFFWMAVWLLFYHAPPPQTPDPMPGLRFPFAVLIRSRQVWALTLARMLEEPLVWMCLFWLPKYMVDVRGLSLMNTGWILTIPFLALDLGYVTGGWLSGRLMRRGWTPRSAKLAVMFAAAVLMTSLAPAAHVAGIRWFIACASVAVMGHGLWFSNVLSMPSDFAPARVVASLYGITGAGGSVGGILFTEATGIVADRYSSFTPLFWAAGFLPLAGTLLLLVMGGGMIAPAAIEKRESA